MVDLAALVGLRTAQVPVPDSLRSSPMIGNLRRSDHASLWGYDHDHGAPPGLVPS
jgi:hypothetical protein